MKKILNVLLRDTSERDNPVCSSGKVKGVYRGDNNKYMTDSKDTYA